MTNDLGYLVSVSFYVGKGKIYISNSAGLNISHGESTLLSSNLLVFTWIIRLFLR